MNELIDGYSNCVGGAEISVFETPALGQCAPPYWTSPDVAASGLFRRMMMASIRVDLDEADIIAACEYWATHRVLNEGKAMSCELKATVCQGKPAGTLNSATVWVERK